MATQNPTTAVNSRSNGTFAAVVDDRECDHKHANSKSADACATWQASAVRKGESRWDAVRTPRAQRAVAAIDFAILRAGETVSEADAAKSHEYIPMKDLVSLWHAVVTGAKSRPAANLMFLGPSGSGKTDGARYLAALIGLPFTKVDSASMTDPEAWFGTREIVVQDGVAVTDYRPSAFVDAIQKPGVVLVDEITRVRDEHRNVLLPLLDMTRSVTNPLTGEVIYRDPQCFVIMAGNAGIHFTGTSAIDPAFMTRALTVEFDYIAADDEQRVVREASGCSEDDAYVFVKFANETRSKSKTDPEFTPISTRECIEAGRLVSDGLTRDLAVKFVVITAASSEGGSASLRQELQSIWNGVRVSKSEVRPVVGDLNVNVIVGWRCPTHLSYKVIPAGTSSRTGKPYNAFRACPDAFCSNTEDRTSGPIHAVMGSGVTCSQCNTQNPVGRTTFCMSCGATL